MLLKFPWRELRERRDRFRADRSRSPQSDLEFLQDAAPVANEAKANWIVILRQLVADLCGVPRGQLYSGDSLREIEKLLGPVTAKEFFLEVALEIVQKMVSSEFLSALEKAVSEYCGQEVRLYGDVEFEKAMAKGWQDLSSLGKWLALLATEIEDRVGGPSLQVLDWE